MRKKQWRAARLSQLGSSIFAEVAAWKREAAKSGMKLIDLGIGSPDRPPTELVRRTLSEAALREDMYAYPATGTGMPFREAAAAWMKYRFGVIVDPAEEIVTLSGSQDGLSHLALSICNPGDKVLLPNPGYPIYEGALALAGVEPIFMPLREENGFMPDLDAISAADWESTRFVLVNYPNNPLSAVADLSFFERLLAKARQHEVLVVQDLAYSEMAFDGFVPPSMLQLPGASDYAVEFHSLSKSFNMAGCRIGFLAGNREVIGALRELKSNIDYGVFEPVQEAGIAALKQAMNDAALPRAGELYERRRDVFLNALHEEGWHMLAPKATMFMWPRLPQMGWQLPDGETWTSRSFAKELLKRSGVIVIPGEAFGSEGEGYVRIALVEEEEELLEAARRIGAFIRGEL